MTFDKWWEQNKTAITDTIYNLHGTADLDLVKQWLLLAYAEGTRMTTGVKEPPKLVTTTKTETPPKKKATPRKKPTPKPVAEKPEPQPEPPQPELPAVKKTMCPTCHGSGGVFKIFTQQTMTCKTCDGTGEIE